MLSVGLHSPLEHHIMKPWCKPVGAYLLPVPIAGGHTAHGKFVSYNCIINLLVHICQCILPAWPLQTDHKHVALACCLADLVMLTEHKWKPAYQSSQAIYVIC